MAEYWPLVTGRAMARTSGAQNGQKLHSAPTAEQQPKQPRQCAASDPPRPAASAALGRVRYRRVAPRPPRWASLSELSALPR